MDNVMRFFRRIKFSYKMTSVLNDWRAFFTIDILIPLMQMLCFSLVGYYVYGAENIEKWAVGNAVVTSAFSAIYRTGLHLARERNSGTLSLMIATKTTISEVLLSSAVSSMLMSFISIVFGLGVLTIVLGLSWTVQKVLELVIVLLVAIFAATCFGFIFSCFILLTTEIHLVTNTADKLLLIFTGANYPVSNLPTVLEQVAYTLPLTRSILLAQKVMTGETIFNNLNLLIGEVLLGVVFLVIGTLVLRVLEKTAIKYGTLDML